MRRASSAARLSTSTTPLRRSETRGIQTQGASRHKGTNMTHDSHGQGPGGVSEDVKVLHSMGYAQELARRMGGFSNFAISFSIICILSGGLNSVAQGISGVGGAALGIGWIVGCCLTLFFALGMGQIGSAYPTAGGLYHWGSILGGRGWGWATAWFNLLGLIFVVSSVDVGVWFLFLNMVASPILGMD